jgi:hypothetical protein
MGDWCGIVLLKNKSATLTTKEITGAKEVSCTTDMVIKKENKTFFDRSRFSLDKGPFNGRPVKVR